MRDSFQFEVAIHGGIIAEGRAIAEHGHLEVIELPDGTSCEWSMGVPRSGAQHLEALIFRAVERQYALRIEDTRQAERPMSAPIYI